MTRTLILTNKERANRISGLMALKNVTPNKLARDAKLPPDTIANILDGKHNINDSILQKVAKRLGVKLAVLTESKGKEKVSGL